MHTKWFAVLLLSFFFVPASAVRAGEKGTNTPTVVVRVQSLNALLQNLNLVVRLVGQEGAADQIEALVKSKIGKQGLEGIDPSHPFGAYVRFGKDIDDITGALLIPMADQKAFLHLLETFNVNFARDKDDIYTHKTNKNFNVYFRFAHKYLYITSVNTESIQDKNLLDPAKALSISDSAMISVVARVDQIPDAAKLIAQAQLEETLRGAEQKDPGNEYRIALLREFNRLLSSLIRETQELRFDLDVAGKTKELTVHLSVNGKPDTELAKTILAMGKRQSPLAGLTKKDAAFSGAVHLNLHDSLSKAFVNILEATEKKSIKGIEKEDRQKQAELFFKALLPSVKAGEFQLVTAVFGPQEKHYTFVAAVKLKEGDKLGKTVHTLIEEASKDIPENLRDKIKLDFETVGNVKIHKFEIPKDGQVDAFLDGIAGDRHLYLAFRDDALFLAVGKESLATLKSIVAKTDGVASLPLVFDFDFARMAPLMAQTQEQKDLAGKLFAEGQNGRVRLTLEGGSNLSVRLQMQLNVLEFLMKMKNAK